MHEMSLPENQAKAAESDLLHRPQPRARSAAAQGQARQFPTSKQNKAVQWFENAEWWAENGEAVNKKWEAFKLGF